MILKKEDFKLSMVERSSKNKTANHGTIYSHIEHRHININQSPTGNCQMALLGGINSLLIISNRGENFMQISENDKKKHFLENLKTCFELSPKRLLLIDLKKGDYGNVNRNLNTLKQYLPKEVFFFENDYTSTNNSKMCLIGLHREAFFEYYNKLNNK